jgi:hypothetical protein
MLAGDLEQKFVESLENIAADLLSALGIAHKKEEMQLSESLLRWIDFRLRYVDPKPRRVHYSNKFPLPLPPDIDNALWAFDQSVRTGADINPFQGKGLTNHHDTSGKKRQRRTDLLWADWGILHFHLTASPPVANEYYAPRSDWLLFALFLENDAAFIDVRPHAEEHVLENFELAETIIRNWPLFAERYRMPGILPGSTALTSEDIKRARIGGVSRPVVIDGIAYLPSGQGVTSASTSQRVSLVRDQARRIAKELAKVVSDPSGQFQSEIEDSHRECASFTLVLTAKGLGIFEEHSQKCWLLPRNSATNPSTPLGALHNLIAPEWLCATIKERESSGG